MEIFASTSPMQATLLKVVFPLLAILAALWAVIHMAYAPGVIAVIFIGGLLLGFARRQTGSVILPMLMHIAWNLYAVW